MWPKSFRKEVIYIQLLNEGAPTIRASYGLKVGEHTYVVLLPSDYDPEDEEWEFPPGSIVVCKREVSQIVYKGEVCLVARSRIEPGKLKDIVDSGSSDMKFS